MIKLFKSCVIFVIILSLAGCASIVKGRSQYVNLDTVPPGATVEVKYPNSEPQTFTTPAQMKLRSGKEPYSVKITKDGYKPLSAVIDSRLSVWFWADLFLGGYFCIITMPIDLSTGGAYTFQKTDYNLTLEPMLITEQANTKK